MTSVERILEYCSLEPEAPRETDIKPPVEWPSKGEIEFDNMSFKYHKTLPRVLHNISCCIKPHEKVTTLSKHSVSSRRFLYRTPYLDLGGRMFFFVLQEIHFIIVCSETRAEKARV